MRTARLVSGRADLRYQRAFCVLLTRGCMTQLANGQRIAVVLTSSVPSPTPYSRDTMTLDELARRMGISLTVAYELARRDDLPVPVIRVGRRYLFSRHAYEALLAAQHQPDAITA